MSWPSKHSGCFLPWNSVILDGTVPDGAVREMIAESYELTRPKNGRRKIVPDWDQ
jgi:predicted DNA-binding protein (MmcQ/YjbR family)